MKLSEEQLQRLRDGCSLVEKAMASSDRKAYAAMLLELCGDCIAIGVEIAMQHRHQYWHGDVWDFKTAHTGPAEAIDHE